MHMAYVKHIAYPNKKMWYVVGAKWMMEGGSATSYSFSKPQIWYVVEKRYVTDKKYDTW